MQMKHLYSLPSSVAAMLVAAAALCSPQASAQTVPVATDFSDYTGTTFVAHWNALGNGETGLLSVFTPKPAATAVSEDFSGICHTNGKIDTANPNYPAGWTVSVTANGTTDMVEQNGTPHLVLDATGDYVMVNPIEGSGFCKFVIQASLINNDGISADNSSKLIVDIYDKSGKRIDGGEMYTYYFDLMPSLDLFADAFYYTPANIGSIRLSVEKGEGKVGDLVINSLSFEYNEPDYVVSAQKVSGTEQLVSGLDAEKEYYYYLKAEHNGLISEMSNIVRVNPFLTPEATEATAISSTSYTANWKRLPKAQRYVVKNYRYEVAATDEETKLLDDDFSKVTEGTTDSPISITDCDAYTAQSGWTGQNIVGAAGMLGANAGRYPMNISYLHSPAMDLSGGGGNYKVHVKAIGTAGDQLSIYRVGHLIDADGDGVAESLNIHKITFDSNGIAEDTYEMTDGAEAVVLSLEESKLKRFFLDEITVSQGKSAGDVTKTLVETVEIDDVETTSHTFTGLEKNATYAFELTGIRKDDYGYDEESAVSNLMIVSLSDASGIDEAAAAGVLHISRGKVVVSLSEECPIILSSADGRNVLKVNGRKGQNTISIPSAGVYVLQAGSKSVKILRR